MQQPERHHRNWVPKPIAWAIIASLATAAYAMPTGPEVVSGTAGISQSGSVMTVQNSANAILNWQRFGINANETVRFLQPSASSAVLNRVVGTDPSAIYGQLLSNGRVWLINPAGVMVGPGGRVDTAGFIASTLNIANQDFLAGRLTFQKDVTAPGSVVNQGTITTPSGGSVYLVGANVSNEGIITTPQGEAILAAGERVSLIDTATPGVKVEITGAAGNSTNLGQIAADAGRIGMAGVLVRNSGTLNASSVVSEGGRVFLKATRDIELTPESRISADGTRGGRIVAKVEDDGALAGTLTGRGELSAIPASGGGGFIETSAATVNVNGIRVNTGGGTWLIDPNNFVIASTGGNTDGATIASGLLLGNVEILSDSGSAPTAGCISASGGNICVNDPITWSSAYTLRLRAVDGISISSNISASHGSGVLSLMAGGSHGVTNNAGTGLLNVSNLAIVSAGDVSITGSNQVGTVAASLSSGSFTLQNGATAMTIGSVTDPLIAGFGPTTVTGITTAGGSISLTSTAAVNPQAVIASNNGDISIQGSNITTTSAGDMAAGSGTVNLSAIASGGLTSIVSGTAISGNTISVKTDQLSLVGTLSGSTVGITRYNGGTELQLGGGATDSAGVSLGITDVELAQITAGTYRFGDTTSDGGLRITGATSIPATRTLSLLTSTVSNSQIVQNATATITADYLRVEGTAVTLNEGNWVGTLAGKTKGQAFSFKNSQALTIGTVDGQSGIDSSLGAQNVTLVNTGGGISDATSSNPIKGGLLDITAAGDVKLLGANAVSSFKANVQSSTVKSDVFFKNTQSLDIAAGGITSYSQLGDVGLWLTSGDLTQSGVISGNSLVVRAEQGNVNLTQPNAITNLAASVGTTSVAENKNFAFKDANGLNVSGGLTSDINFSPINGITVAISGSPTGPVTTGMVDLNTVVGDITQSATGLLAGRGLRAVAQAQGGTGSVLLTEPNYVGVISGSAGSNGGTPYSGSFQFKSQNGVYVTTVAGTAGVSTPETTPANSFVTLTSTGNMVSQDAPIATKSLNVMANTGVMLSHTNNSIASVSATTTTGTIDVSQSVETAMTVVGGTASGNTALNGHIGFSNKNSAGTITVSNPIKVAADYEAYLAAPGALNINAAITGGAIELRSDDIVTFSGGSLTSSTGTYPGVVHFGTYTPGTAIQVASGLTGTSSALEVATGSLANINSPWVVFGSKNSTYGSGTLTVTGVTGASFAATPSVLGFLTMGDDAGSVAGYNITLTNVTLPAGMLAMSSGNAITGTGLQAATVVAETRNTGDALSLTFSSGFSVGSFTVSKWDGSPETHSGVQAGGNLNLIASAGNIVVSQPVTGAGTVAVDAPGGTISGTARITGSTVSLMASGNIGSAGTPLATAGSYLYADSGAGVYIANNSSGAPAAAALLSVNAGGDVAVANWGSFTVGSDPQGVSAGGNISLVAHSPLTIAGPVTSTGNGSITLTAGMAQSSTSSDIVTVNAAVTTGGTITLEGYAVGGSNVPAGAVQSIYTPPPPQPPPPTVADCTANPSLSGCSAVLPSIDSCMTNPTLAGCTAVLPSISTCTTNPTAAGCSAVLPTLATCTTNPTAAGCTAVLPSIDTCTTNPTAAGCTAVLPTISTCTTNPTAAGCTAVLPPLATCTTAPSTPGCTAVLPSVDTCTTNPTQAGCTAVLPTLSSCTTNPTQAGCTAVLPSMSTCTTNPTAPGCTAVLPTVSTCTANPTAAGCSTVLPSLATCTTNPTQAGCSAVLPSVSTCTTNPTATGCSAVLPTLSSCTTNPTQAGCTAVLPSIDSCTTNPAQSGCTAVLPTVSTCTANPTAPGCTVVLPTQTTTTSTTNQVITVVQESVQKVNVADAPAAAPAPPPPLPQTGPTTFTMLNTNQTVGGTEGMFGGAPSAGSGFGGGSTSSGGSAGTSGSSSGGTGAGGASDSGSGSSGSSSAASGEGDKQAKSGAAEEKKEDKKEDKRDEPAKKDDKPAGKKPVGKCSA